MPTTPSRDGHHAHVLAITHDLPTPTAAHDVLAQEGVDASSLDDLMHYAGKRGWSWRLTGGPDFPRCRAVTLAPWESSAPWAQAWGDGLEEALSVALAMTIRRPPPLVDE